MSEHNAGPVSPEKLAILERFGSADVQALCAEVRRLQTDNGRLRRTLEQVRANCNIAHRQGGVTIKTYALILDALVEIAEAIRDERESRLSGEYSDGNLWRLDGAIARLRDQIVGRRDIV